ncbi:LamG-like jellyroll fold domain-containing protein [Streptomyces sp. NPDC056454]|uniref:LamG-like jellyroll fold domain-containing protein n=1 Tax=Streptomyces sp. NPDC056454 TaxID=3345823 RepID=UPI0036C146C5
MSPVVGSAPVASAATATEEPAALTEAQRALASAKDSGERVEVAGERSEHTTVYANPDGFTFTLEESAVPVRVAKSGGGWQAPDPTLERKADGTVVPRAAAVEMEFSPGGADRPLVRIEERGRSLELGWLGALPSPVLDGASALYKDVMDGVDLKVTASAEGFRHVLIVKTPQAAVRPDLKQIDYSLKAEGLKILKGEAGNLTAVDADGKRVFRAPPAQMWDSAGSAQAPRAPMKADAAAASTRKAAEGGVGAATGVEPLAGDTVRTVDVKAVSGSLGVVPDADMLTGTDAAHFPLYIDPPVTWGAAERTLLRSDGYESYGWGNGDDDFGKGVGKCGTWNGYYCGPGYVQRLYFEFSPASLKGKNVLDATFRVTEPWAFQCSPRWVDLVRTNNISPSTTWASRPKELDLMVDRNVSAGRGSLCDPNSPAEPIEFRDNPEETNENLTPTVRDFAAGKFSRLTLQLRAHDETDTSAWKRFRNDAVLAVKYVALPALPTEVGLVTGSGHVCSTNSASPTVVSDPTPLVTGRPKTAAGGESGANLRVRWRTEKLTGSAWATAHTDLDGPTSGYVGNLVKQSRSLPALQEGVQYRLKGLTMSYYEGGTNRLNTGYTTPCYFKVDPTAPKAPRITFGTPYKECTPNACIAAGGPGVTGKFTFAPATGDTNNVAYQYRLSLTDGWQSAGSGSTVTRDIVPARSGTHRLYVQAKDNVGRWGAESVVDFLVSAGEGPVSRWHFGEMSGVAVDSATVGGAPRRDATLAGGAVRDDRGRRGVITHDAAGVPLAQPQTDRGLLLNGSGAHAATNGPVLETRSGYSFSTWVRLDSKDTTGVVLSQDGAQYSPFVLTYEKPYDTWYFGVKEKDQNTGEAYWGRKAETPAQVGVWTHVAGTYDPTLTTLKLYVNGRLEAANTSIVSSWSSTGNMQFGRYKWAGQYGLPFKGSIDEVAVWQRVLSPAEIAAEARLLTSANFAGAELVAEWSPAGGSGSSIADTTSGYGKSLTLSGGATVEGEEIVLDGVDGAATAPGPLVDDTGSFTVTALAALDGAKLASKNVGYIGQVVGQRTADGSAWGFWYKLTGKETVLDEETFEERTVPVGMWHFGRLNADGTFSSVVSDEVAALDGTVRLTGTHDAQSGTISLYLGHNQNGEAQAFTAKLGAGDFAIGKGFTPSGWKYYLPARITEVRLWAGAMASSEQVGTHVGD